MFKQLVLLLLLLNSVTCFAMVYDEDKDGVFYIMGTSTCPTERLVVKSRCIPLQYAKHKKEEKIKDQRSCSILLLLQQFIEQHEYSMPAPPFGISK